MEIFDRPKNLNGSELKEELAKVGVIVDTILDFSDGTIGFECDYRVEAEKVVKAHNGNTIPKEADIQEKLSSVGLNLDDLKVALGLA